MKQEEHLTAVQFDGYRARSLAPGELLLVDEHLADCAECRDQVYGPGFAAARVGNLREEFAVHLDYDQVVACAEGRGQPDLERHVLECKMCRGEVDDLREFRSQLSQTRREPVVMPVRRPVWQKPAWVAAAAGIVLVAGLATWPLWRPAAPPAQQMAQQPAKSLEPALPADQQAAVQLALASHKLERAPVLERLITRQGVLLGGPAEGKTFDILSPKGTAVVADRPVFRWQPLSAAASYVVAVFDDNFEKVAKSPSLTTPEWQPERPLARGRIFNWQVTAKVGGRTVRAPVPPAAEARFQVVSEDAASQIETARREHPQNHLLLAALCAKAGALDDSAKEVDALAATDATLAQSLRQSLDEIRKP
jgi:hypothetical protein